MRFLLALLPGLLPATAWAAAEGGGMPQFETAHGLTGTQIFWMAVIFLILYLVLWLWVLPAMRAVLEERSERIGADLDRAKLAKEEADRAVAELTEATRAARAEAQAGIAAATQAAREQAARQAETLNARLEGELREAEGRIAAARREAMGAVGVVARETASAMIARLTGRAPGEAVLQRAIEASLGRAPAE
ncbi:MAG: F0F1 ATP synthase subunit B [Acetobacteraceae bacterium]